MRDFFFCKLQLVAFGVLLTLASVLFVDAVIDSLRSSEASAAAPSVKKFHLYATDGYAKLADGKETYIWGYSLQNKKGTATVPAPMLTVNEGDRVEVTLTNLGPSKAGVQPMSHTIHWHGLDTDQANDGVPDTSPPVQPGKSFTYAFAADRAGTYFYHCHVDTVEHLQMGMYGAFVVKAKQGAKQVWTGGPAYDKEYVLLFNELDPLWHDSVAEGKPYDRTAYHPRYWTINGKSFPDTLNDPSTLVQAAVGQQVLIRLINAGYEAHSLHMHGFHYQVIATDGRPLPQPYEKDTLSIGPAERYDILVRFDQSGAFPLHSHNIVDNTNDGVYPGGLHTMICVAPKPGADGTDHAAHAAGSEADACQHSAAMPAASGSVPTKSAAEVKIGALSMSVKELHVKVGDTVTWMNADRQAHTATSDDGTFDSGSLFPNGTFSFTFKKAGTYPYACTIHPTIRGKVIVDP